MARKKQRLQTQKQHAPSVNLIQIGLDQLVHLGLSETTDINGTPYYRMTELNKIVSPILKKHSRYRVGVIMGEVSALIDEKGLSPFQAWSKILDEAING